MGALSRPGPQFGAKGPPTPAVRPGGAVPPFSEWFPAFLRDELRPYPGRLPLVLRMTLSATLTMIAIMTFRLPGAAIAGYYTLLLSRDTPFSTVRAAVTVMVMYLVGAAYALLGAALFVDYPLTHFLWVTVSVLLCFYVIKVTKNYVGAAAFAFVITIVVPLWDAPAPTGALVAATLWAAGSVSVGLICTVAVEFVFAGFDIPDELIVGVTTRVDALIAVFRVLSSANDPEARKAAQKVQQLAIVGVSRLRRLAAAASMVMGSPERRSTVVSLVGRAIDLAATLPTFASEMDPDSKERLGELADQLVNIRQHLGRAQPRAEARTDQQRAQHPAVGELERVIHFLQLALASGPESLSQDESAPPSQNSPFVSDAFTNPDHLWYSLRGCLAAMLCYVIFNAIAWRGLSTSLATCVITALSSIGSSRQKQVLRISGAIVGGLVFGVGSQVLILPMLDSIAGFAVLFATVTFIAAWISTSSPRISYFGLQIALAFYLIHLQEYFPQTNLAIARDRVMGVALGLVMMWLVFDTLGSKPAAEVMRQLFATNLRLLAQLARPWREGKPADIPQLRALRDTISNNFGSVNSQADAVLFEVGPSRARDLRLRERLLAWQPRLRSVFLLEVGLLQYRANVDPSELAPEVFRAQETFDERISDALTRMAEAFSGAEAPQPEGTVRHAFEELEAAVQRTYAGHPTPRAQGVLVFSSTIAETLDRLQQELADDPLR